MNLIENVRALLMEKQAAEAAQANLSIEPNAAMAAEQTAVEAAAKQSGGTVEQQATESLQKGLATQSAQAGAYDKVEAELDKAAALLQLMDEGDSFYEAFEKVAQADMELQKQAAYETLVEAGMGFEEAVSLVKEAAEKGPYGYSHAYEASSKAGIRATGHALVGAAGVGATGYGVGRIAGAIKGTSSKVIEHGSRPGKIGQAISKLKTSGSRKAGAIGAAVGGVAGLIGGDVHGHLSSLRQSLNEAHAAGKASK